MKPNFENTEIAFRYRSDSELKRANLLFSFIASPILTRVGILAVQLAMGMHLPITWIVKSTIFRHFCGGETLEETAKTAAFIGKYHVETILDYGVEGGESEVEYDKAVAECLAAVLLAARSKNIPFVSLKISGYCRFDLLEKKHSGAELTTTENAEWVRVCKRVNEICETASRCDVKVLIDAEETWIQNPCNEITEKMMELYNQHKAMVFNTFQMYCYGTFSFLSQAITVAKRNGYVLGAKLVRGAYMEKERARAIQDGYENPIQPNKESTDKDFDDAILLCLKNLDKLSLFIGTHNEQSCNKAMDIMAICGIAPNDPRVIFSQLYGMSDNLSFNLAAADYNVAKYVPYGPVKSVIPYLLRRATENTSIAGQTSRELALIRKELSRRKI